jgi:hypothetical protein
MVPGSSTVVGHLPRHPKAYGSNPATGSVKEEKKKILIPEESDKHSSLLMAERHQNNEG